MSSGETIRSAASSCHKHLAPTCAICKTSGGVNEGYWPSWTHQQVLIEWGCGAGADRLILYLAPRQISGGDHRWAAATTGGRPTQEPGENQQREAELAGITDPKEVTGRQMSRGFSGVLQHEGGVSGNLRETPKFWESMHWHTRKSIRGYCWQGGAESQETLETTAGSLE